MNQLQKFGRLSLIGDQRSVCERHFAELSALAANLLLVGAIFSVGPYISPLLFLSLEGFIAIQILSTWTVLKFVDLAEPVGFGGYIVKRTNNYVGHLESIYFLVVFGFLVVDFLLFSGVNILIAILSFLMTRRLLVSLKTLASAAVQAKKQCHRIDSLLFLPEWHTRRQPGNQQKLSRYFSVQDRPSMLAKVLTLAGVGNLADLLGLWPDPGAPENYLLDVHVRDEPDPP